MKSKNYQEIKKLSLEELNVQLTTTSAYLRKLKFAHAVSPIENPMRIRHTRKRIAQLKTEQRIKLLESNVKKS